MVSKRSTRTGGEKGESWGTARTEMREEGERHEKEAGHTRVYLVMRHPEAQLSLIPIPHPSCPFPRSKGPRISPC